MSVDFQIQQGDRSVSCAVITVSDTRTEETDKSGRLIKEVLSEAGHTIIDYAIVQDDQTAISATLGRYLSMPEIEVAILNGGTGIAKRDVTIEVVQDILEKEMPGFGEIFRFLSFTEEIGTGAMLSRAMAGVANNTLVFALPGSTGAVRLGMTRLILPELRHLVHEITK